MSLFAAVVLGLSVLYAALMGSAAIGLVRLIRREKVVPPEARPSSSNQDGLPSVSILVPARNEAGTIESCLDSVFANDCPEHLYEVIVIDDGSTDGTGARVRRHPRARSIRLIEVEDEGRVTGSHKKHALARGVAAARGAIILTTDADCTVSPTWIRSMMSRFEEGVGIVTGPVLYRDDGRFFGRLQSLEFLGLVALGHGFVGIGRPHLCNSANLAYRRQAYDEVGGYDGGVEAATGNDELLLHHIAYGSRWTAATCIAPEAAVFTNPSPSLSSFFDQRRRWASAHAKYPLRHLTVISLLCYLFYVALAASALMLRWELLMAALVLKASAEAAVLAPAAWIFGRLKLLPLLVIAQPAQIAYVLIIGFAGTFGGYEWKGRVQAGEGRRIMAR